MAGNFERNFQKDWKKSSLYRHCLRYATDVLVLAFVIIMSIVVHYLPPRRGGFTCLDPSLRYPNKPDTVSLSVLYVFSTLVPFTVFYVVELNSESHRVNRNYIRLSLRQVLNITCSYTFGLCVTVIFSGCGKIMSGQLRPNFYKVCKPNVTNCRPGQFIWQYECTSQMTSRELDDVFRGFPSTHAACATYAMVFTTLYLQARLHVHVCALFRPVLQGIGLCVAYYFSLSRISDYKHRWSDVLAGAVLGISLAIFTASRVSRLLSGKSGPPSSLASLSRTELEEREQLVMTSLPLRASQERRYASTDRRQSLRRQSERRHSVDSSGEPVAGTSRLHFAEKTVTEVTAEQPLHLTTRDSTPVSA